MTQPLEEEAEFVEMALRAAEAGQAGHWPTVAGHLRAEVLRLRAAHLPVTTRHRLDRWITRQWNEIGRDAHEYNGADWCRGGRDVLRNLSAFLVEEES